MRLRLHATGLCICLIRLSQAIVLACSLQTPANEHMLFGLLAPCRGHLLAVVVSMRTWHSQCLAQLQWWLSDTLHAEMKYAGPLALTFTTSTWPVWCPASV